MPVLPREYAKELPPVATGEGIYGALLGRSLAGSGAEIERMGDALIEAHRVSVFNRKVSQASIDLLKMQETASQDTDYPTMAERYEGQVAEYRSALIEDIGDPELNELVSRKFDEIAAQKLVAIRSYARKGIITEGEASVATAVDAYLDAIVNATSEQERANYLGLAKGTIAGGVTAGYYYADKAQAMLAELERNLPVKQVEHDLFALGPDAVLKRLENNNLVKNFYPGLQDDDRYTLLQRVRHEKSERDKKAAGAYEITDPDIEAMVANKILHWQGPQITLQELQQYHGNGLSTKRWEHWQGVLLERTGTKDTLNSERDFAVENGLKSIDQHYRFETDVEELSPGEWASLKNAFWQRTRSATTAKEVEEIYEEILAPYRKKKAKNLLEKLWSITTIGIVSSLFGGKKEEEARAEERRKPKVKTTLSPELAKQLMQYPVGTEVELTDGRVYRIEQDGPKQVR